MELTRRRAITAGTVLALGGAFPLYDRREACALIAHRGYADLAPENTLAAFRTAAPTADAIEFDVRLAADGVPVVVHDHNLDRIAGIDGAVEGYDADELAAMDVLDSDEGIPSVRRALETVPPAVGLVVDMKEGRALEPTIELLSGVDSPAMISTSDVDTLEAARRLAPELARGYSVEADTAAPLTTAIDLGCAAVNPTLDVVLTSRILPRAHRAGLRVNAWAIRRRPAPSVLATLGVDGVVADRALLPGARRGERTRRWIGD